MYLDNVYKKKRKVNKEGLSGLLLSIGPVLGFVLFGLVPMVVAIFMSFMDIYGFSLEGAEFIGLNNYKSVLQDSLFWKSIVKRRSARFTLYRTCARSLR